MLKCHEIIFQDLHIVSNHALKPHPHMGSIVCKTTNSKPKVPTIFFYLSMLYLDVMESLWVIMWVCEVRHVGVNRFILYVLQLLLNRLVPSPHMLVLVTSERFLPAGHF